jgi:hypothetical protein
MMVMHWDQSLVIHLVKMMVTPMVMHWEVSLVLNWGLMMVM